MTEREATTLTAERARQVIAYDPETGILTRISGSSRAGRFIGKPVGSVRKDGYLEFSIDGKTYLAHRVAWLLAHGDWPTLLDHRNRDRADNRLANLRLASEHENGINHGISASNTSGVTGVFWDRTKRRWKSYIRAYGVSQHGSHKTFEEAVAARRAAETEQLGEWRPQ